MIELVVFAAIFLLVLWLISIIPLPPMPGAFPLRTILYVMAIIIAIVFLWRFIP